MNIHKKNIKKVSLCVLLLTSVCTPMTQAVSFDSASTKTVHAWMPYWTLTSERDVYEKYFIDDVTHIHVFAYAFSEDGAIVNVSKDPQLFSQTLTALHKTPATLIATFTNDVLTAGARQPNVLKDPVIVHELLSNPARRRQHIQELLTITNEIGAAGIDIDYEKIGSRDHDLFSLFIKELAEMLHAQGKVLYVSVAQKTSDHRRSGPGAKDWRAIASSADMVIIMCYNYSTKHDKPGPMCPPHWLEKIIRFAITHIPRDKICIALPLHGFDWTSAGGASVYFQKAENIRHRYNASLAWSAYHQTPYFTYRTKGIKHEVWLENNDSIAIKLQMVKRFGIRHVAFWHLGTLDQSFQPALRSFRD